MNPLIPVAESIVTDRKADALTLALENSEETGVLLEQASGVLSFFLNAHGSNGLDQSDPTTFGTLCAVERLLAMAAKSHDRAGGLIRALSVADDVETSVSGPVVTVPVPIVDEPPEVDFDSEDRPPGLINLVASVVDMRNVAGTTATELSALAQRIQWTAEDNPASVTDLSRARSWVCSAADLLEAVELLRVVGCDPEGSMEGG